MGVNQGKHRAPILLVGLLSGQLILMSLQARHPETQQSLLRVWAMTVFSPFLSATANVASTLTGLWNSYADLRRVRQENQLLRRELDELRAELHNSRERAELVERLQRLAGFQQLLPPHQVAAEVVGRDVTGWFQTIFINKGRQDGIHLNAVVLTPDGLVGRITAVGPLNAQVQLITDERSGVGAIIGVLSHSRALGVVEGRGQSLCRMSYIPGSVPVTEGEVVYTTGQDGIYPRGIPIGRVVAVEDGSTVVSQEITLRPLADLGKLEEVVVLLAEAEPTALDKTVISER